MNTRFLSLSLVFLLFSFHTSFGQELPEIVPLSPEASAFEEYTNTPVNLYKGSPEISIPIFTASANSISLPISLTYDASGIRVSQIASTVGLGWNLNHGGMVTRKVNGLPDQETNGSHYTKVNSTTVANLFNSYNGGNSLSISASTATERFNIINMVSDYEISDIDLEADTFNFSVNGLSGTIAMDYENNEAFCMEHPDLLVQYTIQSNDILKWEIIDKNGVKYVFSKKENTKTSISSLSNEYNYEYTSAWHLTEISNNENEIELTYTNGSFWSNPQPHFKNKVTETEVKPRCDMGGNLDVTIINLPDDSRDYQISQPYFTGIKVNGELVLSTTYNSNRTDLLGRSKLEDLIIYSKGNPIKTYEFIQSYFTTPTGIQSAIAELNYRLKLDELRIHNNQVGTSNSDYNSYFFSYMDDDELPPRDSASQDYWGYYNGSSHSSMVAGNTDEMSVLRTISVNGYTNNGSPRNTSFNYLKKGTLNKVTYPTGGSTEYFYQESSGNEYLYSKLITPSGYFPEFTGGFESNTTTQDVQNFIKNPDGSWCDDIQFGGVPKTQNITFSINSDDLDKWSTFTLDVVIHSGGTGANSLPTVSHTPFDKYYIYKSSGPKTYCQLREMDLYGDPNLVSSGNPYNSLEVKHIFTEVGTYYITMISNKDRTYRWNYKRVPRIVEYSKQDKLGGMRVYKIETKPNENEKLTKLYYYNNAYSLFGEFDELVASYNQQQTINFLNEFNSLYTVVDSSDPRWSVHTIFPIPITKINVYKNNYVYLEQNADGVFVSNADVTYTRASIPASASAFGTEEVTILANHVPIINGNFTPGDEPDITWISFDAIKNDIMTVSPTGTPPSFISFLGGKISSQTNTSGIVHQKLLFNKLLSGTGPNSSCSSSIGGAWAGETVEAGRYYYEKLQRHSYNLAPKTKHNMAYSTVSEIQVSDNGFNGYTVYNFYNQDEGSFIENHPTYNVNLNGNISSVLNYDSNNNIIKSSHNIYSKHYLGKIADKNGYSLNLKKTHLSVCELLDTSNGYYHYGYTTSTNCNSTLNDYFINPYNLGKYWNRLDATIEKTYTDLGNIQSSNTYNYLDIDLLADIPIDTHYQPAEIIVSTSDDIPIITKTFYPDDVDAVSSLGADDLTNSEKAAIDKLKIDQKHHISNPIQIETYEDENEDGIADANELLSRQRINYKEWITDLILPEKVQTSKGVSGVLEDRITYHDYDDIGNPIEVSKTDGSHIYYIWGYNNKYPIAKIENFTSTEAIAIQSLINTAITESDEDNDRTLNYLGKEGDLRQALDNIRNNTALSNAMISTYTYDPLIGVTSMTDSRGYTTYYEYDDFNRLKQVKDANGNILSENEYNYKQ